ncbi:Gyltl1b protein [Salpingoeca rosetta]|uniref:Gyltl1b protein n=1 Tax=Salpingoeca rosetta (strain ATCC 50818 / BSB-021) TaxID=946362 RepID=F2UC10_SALR5|nr:Gyltl1b protein [Salpingoeca rosetta]EGD74117.1 Gyltl1b protein [Salpingoeca rosetta]|eukprot:XP_004993018.1 Gyltl1b protein [Salpingoeca rosetta]
MRIAGLRRRCGGGTLVSLALVLLVAGSVVMLLAPRPPQHKTWFTGWARQSGGSGHTGARRRRRVGIGEDGSLDVAGDGDSGAAGGRSGLFGFAQVGEPDTAVVRKLVISHGLPPGGCDTVHLAAVSVGYAQSAHLRTMLKSILLHRSLPIHLHVITDDATLPVLDVMLGTWGIRAFNYTLYPGDRHLSAISWVETSHYSGQYPLLKLLLPTLLADVQHVIALDTDLTFRADIAELWRIFAMFEAEEAIGVVENLSGGERRGGRRLCIWRARARVSPHSPLCMASLSCRRSQRNWANVWRDTTRAVLSDNRIGVTATALADQDIINAVLNQHPEWMLLLSCVWNFQLSEHSLAQTQCSARDALVVHWNTRAKDMQATLLDDNAFRALRDAYEISRRVDGALLTSTTLDVACDSHTTAVNNRQQQQQIQIQQQLQHQHQHQQQQQQQKELENQGEDGGGGHTRQSAHRQPRPQLSALSSSSSSSSQSSILGVMGQTSIPRAVRVACPPTYLSALQAPLRVHPYFIAYDASLETESEITLVTHFTLDRLQAFVAMAETWQGPISAAVFISEHDAFTSLAALHLTNVALHVVYQDPDHDGSLYPINRLRNMAISLCRTPYFLHLDVDFSFRSDLHAVLGRHVRAVSIGELNIEASMGAARGTALVVPAFESVSYKRHVPDTKERLLWELSTGQMQPFRVSEWPQGHSATDFARWKQADAPYLIQHQSGFEPYLVLPKTAPPFDETFLGFGWNKVSHIEELVAARFNLFVVPDAYVVHTPHHASADLHAFRANHAYRHCLGAVLASARTRIAHTYAPQGSQHMHRHGLAHADGGD